MYHKNLTEEFRLRLSELDMNFLKQLSEERSISVSEFVRSIIGEYRRSLKAIDTLNQAVEMVKNQGGLSNGDTKTDFNNII